MIPCTLPPPPPDYESEVRAPGTAFLARIPHPRGRDWSAHRYWSSIHTYLYAQLNGICMYCSTFTPRRPSRLLDHTSIDHYVPKSSGNHLQAYEWDNFRLCRTRLNHRKSDHLDVLDPCAIQPRWFRMSFVTFALTPDPALKDDLRKKVLATISRLELNEDDAYVNERARAVYSYADKKLPFPELQRRYPLVANEMIAQNFDVLHMPRFDTALTNARVRAALVRQGWIA
jgi:hypothetical protein